MEKVGEVRMRCISLVHPSLVTSLPILMYHSISDDPESGVRPYYRVCTSPQRFREQMQWLKDKGYRGVTLSDGLAWLDTAKQKVESRDQKAVASNGNPSIANRQSSIVNTKLVVLTFDDGFHDFHTALGRCCNSLASQRPCICQWLSSVRFLRNS